MIDEPWTPDDELRAAAALLSAAEPSRRAAGYDRLAARTAPGKDALRAWAVDTVLPRVEREPGGPALAALVDVLGAAQDERALPVLLELAGHPDGEVRLAVAKALPFVGEPAQGSPRVRALLALSRDAAPAVRDAAVFGLGTQGEAYGPAVRAALHERLDDEDEEVAEEAVRGLARRQDASVLPRLIDLLETYVEPHPLTLSAAAVLGRPELLPVLAELAAERPEDRRIAAALDACDPARRAERSATAWRLLEELDARRPDLDAALVWDRFSTDLRLEVHHPAEPGGYLLDALLRRAGHEPSRAASLVDADVPPADVPPAA
ncbi:HEAT repeat domain-containing protein [Kitasatospora sp. NA04385]|uniref:HEAT repeat domain-containing protein n=1 Tax=Kitasatospora sp. NA04385 TaxID=2742135 RepID=UPI001591C069|nr:HEAT repeat domain-containing protein [Kitasatospora sp. NA04385]QKW18203.1 HEAT repeat domain-containing protein [Kitasatospora sp. NA04385]